MVTDRRTCAAVCSRVMVAAVDARLPSLRSPVPDDAAALSPERSDRTSAALVVVGHRGDP